MKNIDLTKVEDLTSVKENMINIFDKKINEAKLNNFIDNVNSLSFVECKQLFEGLSDKLFDTEKGKKIIGKYASTIKECKELKTLYILSENLTTRKEIIDTKMYVMECSSFANKVSKKDMKKFHNIIKEAIKFSGLNSEELSNILNINKELNESINFVLSNKKKPSNLSDFTKHVTLISESLNKNVNTENNTEYDSDVNSLTDIMESKNLEDWEKEVIEEITLCNLSGNNKLNIFEKYKEQCLSLIDENLENSENLETTSRLNTMKGQLSERVYKEDSANEDILCLAELKKTLSEA